MNVRAHFIATSDRSGRQNESEGNTMQLGNGRRASAEVSVTRRSRLARDRQTLDQCFFTHSARLYRTAYRLLGSYEDAEDAVQDGLLSALKHLKSFAGRAKASTWLTRIVINAALMRLRRRRTLRFISIDQRRPVDGDLPLANKVADEGPGPQEAFAREEELRILANKMTGWPVGLRRAFWLRYIEGFSVAETARELSSTEGAIKARLYRARVKLLGEHCDPA
jgi:RNA polymerase sigma-70 factor (ECF subfamily)